jgi:hypothetical protein
MYLFLRHRHAISALILNVEIVRTDVLLLYSVRFNPVRDPGIFLEGYCVYARTGLLVLEKSKYGYHFRRN